MTFSRIWGPGRLLLHAPRQRWLDLHRLKLEGQQQDQQGQQLLRNLLQLACDQQARLAVLPLAELKLHPAQTEEAPVLVAPLLQQEEGGLHLVAELLLDEHRQVDDPQEQEGLDPPPRHQLQQWAEQDFMELTMPIQTPRT